MITRIRRALRRFSNNERGSLPLAMLLIMVGSMLAALLLPVVVGQITATRSDTTAVRTLGAAQAGLEVGLAHIRGATSGVVNDVLQGALSAVPCAPIPGTMAADPSAAYSVTIVYLDASVDPTGHSWSWITDPLAVPHRTLSCINGGGLQSTPSYAVLRSVGTTSSNSKATTRTLQATYVFRVSNANAAGGAIAVGRTDGGPALCLDGGSTSPPVSGPVRVQLCNGSAQQKWAYTQNLSLVLTSTQTNSSPLGLCIDGGTTHVLNSQLVLKQCADTTAPAQMWSLNGIQRLLGTVDGLTLDNTCLGALAANTADTPLVIADNCQWGAGQSMQPAATVGAGRAGAALGQLINYALFGQCLDVTGSEVNNPFDIVYACKQTPDPNATEWNQRWATPAIVAPATSATGKITTNAPQGLYCLYSPLTTAALKFVKVMPCAANGADPAAQWTVFGVTGTYTTSYRIQDTNGNCLQPLPDGSGRVSVAACSGSGLQKWNALPGFTAVAVQGIGEEK